MSKEIVMQSQILDYLQTQRVGILAIEMTDGSPHAATVHFAAEADGSHFYFWTPAGSRKVESLQTRPSSRASVVIGADETNMKTLQMDGECKFVLEQDRSRFDSIYFGKFPEKVGKFPDAVALVFSPSWWRFTDWTTPQGRVVLNSKAE